MSMVSGFVLEVISMSFEPSGDRIDRLREGSLSLNALTSLEPSSDPFDSIESPDLPDMLEPTDPLDAADRPDRPEYTETESVELPRDEGAKTGG